MGQQRWLISCWLCEVGNHGGNSDLTGPVDEQTTRLDTDNVNNYNLSLPLYYSNGHSRTESEAIVNFLDDF